MHAVEILDHEQDITDNFLGAIQTNNSAKPPTSPWTVPVAINGTVVTFKIDTGRMLLVFLKQFSSKSRTQLYSPVAVL